MYNALFLCVQYSSDKKGEGTAEPVPVEGDVQGNVQVKMVVSNGKVSV